MDNKTNNNRVTKKALSVRVAVPVPLRRLFDYLPPDGEPLPAAGCRVRVPFGQRTLIGIVIDTRSRPDQPLKKIRETLDPAAPLLPDTLYRLLHWAAGYYHHPLGEVLQNALPTLLRKGETLSNPLAERRYFAAAGSDPDAAALQRAPKQRALLARLLAAETDGLGIDALGETPNWRDALRRLREKRLVEERQIERNLPETPVKPRQVELSEHQQQAVSAILATSGRFEAHLLHGVTGSGKTEVYLEAAQHCIERGRQILVLVPEIALTPQLVARFRERLGNGVVALHSGLTDSERYRAWWLAKEGRIDAILGTRSAVFTPLARPGLIIVDEEHDGSFKQQDGFRYHARSLAMKRASLEQTPIVLGSATPSLETLHNAANRRYHILSLPERAGAAEMPRIATVDLRKHRAPHGLSPPVLDAIKQRLQQREQVIVFINRRGFAPTVQCAECGWQAQCRRCDARLTLHRRSRQLRCHHCGASHGAPEHCPQCGGETLFQAGEGTQRIEEALEARFPEARLVRLDRDAITNQAALEEGLETIRSGQADIVIGTQLIAKGHDFPRVTLVCVVNADQGLYSSDFRAPEHLFQQLLQVAGRAGRAERPGEVLIQTLQPDNLWFEHLRRHDFDAFAQQALAERRQAGYPPFSHLALWRAESTRPGAAVNFLRHVAAAGRRLQAGSPNRDVASPVEIMDAVPSPMEKRAGRYRAQLLVRCRQRGPLHRLLESWLPATEADREARKVRWSIDIDPTEMF